MKLYLSRIEQFIVAFLILCILGAGFAVTYNYGKNKGVSTAVANVMPPQPKLSTAKEDEDTKLVPERPEILIHIIGEVRKPGVYKMKDGDRVQDAIMIAGGAKKNADPDQLNLASKLIDGEKIIVPGKFMQSQTTTPRQPLVVYDTPASKKNMTTADAGNTQPPLTNEKVIDSSKPVSVNKATADELANRLPGIGPGTAQKIVEYRIQNGAFKDLSELVNVPGLGPKTVEKITPYIIL